MTQLHENIDEGNVSLLVQQCRRDRAESCLKLLSGLCHRLCIPFTLNGEDEQPRVSQVCSIWYGSEIMSSHTGAEKRRLALVTSSLGPVYTQATKFQEGRDSRLFQLYARGAKGLTLQWPLHGYGAKLPESLASITLAGQNDMCITGETA